MMRRFNIAALFYLVCVSFACSQTYYVDSKAGKDSNDGLSPSTAWQTLAKASSTSVKSGSKVLLRRGCEWRGQIIAPANNITYSAYGEGSKPVVNASRIIGGWTPHSGSIYKATVPFEVKAVYCDGEYQELAHWPDDDWLLTDEGSTSGDSIIDNDLSAPASILGAGIVVRTQEHMLVNSSVTSHNANRVGYDMTKSTATINSQYYFNNKLWMLNRPGEWFYDKADQTLYLWPKSGRTPNEGLLEVPEFNYGISIQGKKGITIENIAVVLPSQHGVIAAGTADSLVLRDLDISKIRSYGILILDLYSGSLVERCKVSDCGVNGIMIVRGSQCVIRDNVVQDIGMEGRFPELNTTAGIFFSDYEDVTIAGNRISRLSKGGIVGGHAKAVIRNNVVDQVMLRFNDNGGIYLCGDGSRGSQIIGNIVTNSWGDPRPGSWGEFGQGIYLDDRSDHVTVTGNTVMNAANGYLIHDAFNNEMSGNVAYNCRVRALHIQEDTIAGTQRGDTIENIITRNQLVGSVAKSLVVLSGSLGHYDFGTYDQNYYCNMASNLIGTITSPSLSGSYSMEDWRNATGQDSNSIDVGSYYRYAPFGVLSSGSNLILNASFDSNTGDWSRWSPGGATTISWSNVGGLDGGSIRVVNADPAGTDGRTMSNHFSLEQGMEYYLSVDLIAPVPTNVQVVVRLDEGNYEAYGVMNCIVTSLRARYKMHFHSSKPVANARLYTHVKGPAEFYMDNVVFAQAEVQVNDPAKATRLLINDQSTPKAISLDGETYSTIEGRPVAGTVMLEPYSSMVLLRSYNNEDAECNNWETPETAPGDCAPGQRGNNYASLPPDSVAPTKPAGLSAQVVSATAIRLSWTASTDPSNGSGLMGYRIYRNGTLIGTAPSTTFTDTGLIAGATYSYQAVAFDASGNASGFSATATVVPHDETFTTFAAWVAGNFTTAEQANTAISGSLADPSGCGVPNLLRYAFRLPARGSVANPVTGGTSTSGSASYLTLTFPRRATATGLAYTLESSTDLVTWTAVPGRTYTPGSSPITAQDAIALGSTPRRFLRLRITKP